MASQECSDMKERFSLIDVYETGRIKLADFYKATPEYAWQFLESEEYLAESGSLDKSSSWLSPQLIISNYMQNNCLSTSLYYSTCCPNMCDGVYQYLESHI